VHDARPINTPEGEDVVLDVGHAMQSTRCRPGTGSVPQMIGARA
jgi:hypothetical protein